MSILEELYNGNICPGDKFFKKGGKYHKLMTIVSDNADRLVPMLSDEGLKLWNEIRDAELSMEKISEKESFVDGFCIGARMMLEILSEDRIDRELP